MPGNNSESLQGIAEDEKERMASHGLGEQYCYLSASHTPPKPLLIDGSPYHTPFHYVLQEMLKEGAPEVATEISKQPDPKEVLKLIEKLEDIDERLFNYVTTNHIAASSLLKRALFATFVEDGNKPTKLGEELLKTKGRPLVATNELGYEGWGWGATMNADQTEAKGSNLLGHHLGELRDWLEDQNRGIGVKPAAAPTATPASPSAPSTPTAATARSTKRKKPLPAIPPADLEFPAPPTIPGMPQGVHVSAPPTDLPPAFPGDEQG
jgi:predicted NAD-dependent protein-ADP-ribosyltransferase YbiA (DUF1768 family)